MNARSNLAIALLLASAGVSAPLVMAEGKPEVSATSQVVELPRSVGSGDAKEVSILLDESHLKLATIALRQGTNLTSHSAPVPVTIQVLEGEGIIHIGGKPVHASKGTVVSLAAGEEHDVVPEPGSAMLLLVHYLRTGRGKETPPTEGHGH